MARRCSLCGTTRGNWLHRRGWNLTQSRVPGILLVARNALVR